MEYFHELKHLPTHAIIFLDIDGTFTGEGSWDISKEAVDMLELLKKTNKIHLCSNGKNEARKAHFAKVLRVPLLKTHLRKPDKAIVSLVQNKENQPLVVIGNLAFKDGRFAKNSGAQFIKVKTLLGPDDTLFSRFIYWIDDHLILPLL